MRSNRRALIVAALLAFLVTVSGCLGGGGTATDAQEIRNQTLAAMEDVETATFEMEMGITAGGQHINMTADGALDRAARQMRMNLSTDAGPRSLQTTQYVDGDTMYMHLDGQWISRNLSSQTPGENFWNNTQFVQQMDALENATVELNGTTTVDGNEVHVLDVQVDEATVRDLIQQQGTTGGALENVDVGEVQFTQYVDTESHYVRQVDMQMDMSVQGRQATATMTMTFDDFGEDVSIQIPDEAKRSATSS